MREVTTRALADVRQERVNLDRHWGGPKLMTELSPGAPEAGVEIEHSARLHMEEFGASWDGTLLAKAGCALSEPDPKRRRAELIQVAAVALAWAEMLDDNGHR